MNKTLKALLWTGAGVAAVATANNAVFSRAKALGNALGGEGRFWPGPYGDIFYTRQGKGRRVVLLHGIYAGASGYEWRKNFDALSEHDVRLRPRLAWLRAVRQAAHPVHGRVSMWSSSTNSCAKSSKSRAP